MEDFNLSDFGLCDDVTPAVPAAEVSLCRAFNLRQYQADGITSIAEGFKDWDVKRQLGVLATGGGKTILFAALAKLEVESGGRVLILAHTDELLDQAIEKLKRSTGLKAAKEKSNQFASRFDKVVVGSVQSLQRVRLTTWPKKHFSLIVVDEAHRSLADSYQNILKHFDAKVVGVTATSDRGDKKALGNFYQRIAFDVGLLKLVREGWLVRPLVKTMPVKIDLKGIKSKGTADGQDFDRMEVAHRISPYLDAIAAAIKVEAPNRKVILFLPSVETAQMMSDAMNRVGISCDSVDGDPARKEDRKRIINDYKAGKLQAICNMALLTEGFDHDAIDTLVILRPTKIRSLFAQMVGRGTRPLESMRQALADAPDAEARRKIIADSGKPHVTVLDFLWLYERHDLIRPASLVTSDPKVVREMVGKDGDLIDLARDAERDLLKKLEKEVRKNENRKSRVVDPLAMAAEMGDIELADYEPETARDSMPPSANHLRILEQNGVNTKLVTCFGHAQALASRILWRHKMGYCTIRQMHFLSKLGIECATMPKEEAYRLQQEKIAGWEAKRAQKAAKPPAPSGDLFSGSGQTVGAAAGVGNDLDGTVVPDLSDREILDVGDRQDGAEVLEAPVVDGSDGVDGLLGSEVHHPVAVDARGEDHDPLVLGKPELHAVDHEWDWLSDFFDAAPPIVPSERAV